MEPRPLVGVSRCLLGEPVRYDGQHKADAFLLDALAPHVRWMPVCPEVDAGMGVPREPVQLTAARDGVPAGPERVRLLGVRSGTDWTADMSGWAARRALALRGTGLAGFVLKAGSPSCGRDRVWVHRARRAARRTGRGLFAEALATALPLLPVEDEERLRDADVRDHFLERVFAGARLGRLFGGPWTRGSLVRFHTAHKLQLLAHARTRYDALGQLVARQKTLTRAALAERYQTVFMTAMSVPATSERHVDVMQHMLGHLKRHLTAAEKDDLLRCIEDYRSARLPLSVPLAWFRHHARRHRITYLEGQTYLAPGPRERALRHQA
jgi:uncharacterized protein YbgA (DUF1722 family)/uncharacterized protein YbbK (DUF523 family)